jgi:hypothetical protein
LQHHVLRGKPNVVEEHITSTVRVKAKQKTGITKQQLLPASDFLLGLLFLIIGM